MAFTEYRANIGGFGIHIRYKINLLKKNEDIKLIVTYIKDTIEFNLKIWPLISVNCYTTQLEFKKSVYDNICVIHVRHNAQQIVAHLNELGYGVLPEDKALISHGKLGIERLDRGDQLWMHKRSGPIKNPERWNYSSIPAHWEIPFKWDILAKNVYNDTGLCHVKDIPRPLQHYVIEYAKQRFTENKKDIVNTYLFYQKYFQEEIRYAIKMLCLNKDISCSTQCLLLYKQWNFIKHLCISSIKLIEKAVVYLLTFNNHKCATSRLSVEQNKQILNCLYHIWIAPFDKECVNICKKISQVYLFMSGTTGREIGGYVQSGNHVGEGTTLRNIKNKDHVCWLSVEV